jgi:hypothetical protein
LQRVEFAAIDTVPADQLDRLTTGRGLLESAAWMRYCELASRGSLSYTGLVDAAGRLVALTAVHHYRSEPPFAFRRPAAFLDDMVDASGCFPCVIGVLDGVHTMMLVDPSSPLPRADVVRELVSGLAETTVAFPYFPDRADAEAAAQALEGPALVTSAVAKLVVEWDDFEGYLGSLSKHQRSNVRRERRQYADAGYQIEVGQGTAGLDQETALLQTSTLTKHGTSADVAALLEGYELLRATVDQQVVTFRTRLDGVTKGITVCLQDGETLYVRATGLAGDNSSFAYFNTGYYAPIEWGCANGIRSFGYGAGAPRAKQLRGCALEPRYGAFRWPGDGPDYQASALRRSEGVLEEIGRRSW